MLFRDMWRGRMGFYTISLKVDLYSNEEKKKLEPSNKVESRRVNSLTVSW